MSEIVQELLPVPSKRRSGEKIKGVAFIVAHDTGNEGSTAKQNVDYFVKSANDMEASSHYFVDDKQTICCVPETEKAWHVRYIASVDNLLFGKDANDWALGIELCYGKEIDNLLAYKNYVDLIASLCVKYGLDPMRNIVGHYKLDPDRRTDPLTALKLIGKTWEQFLADVNSMKALKNPKSAIELSLMDIKEQIRTKMTEVNTLLDKLL